MVFYKTCTFEAPCARSKEMYEIIMQFGWEGYGAFLALLDWAQDYHVSELNELHFKTVLGISKKKAQRYLPLFNKILPSVLEATKLPMED